MSNEGYFWYSNKQAKTIYDLGHYHTNYCQLDNGKIMPYTEWTHEPKTTSLWDDMRLLGHGKYHQTKGG